MENLVIYRCNHCGNIAVKLKDVGVPLVCCGEVMQPLTAKNTDGAVEKHKPVVQIENGVVKVCVGEVAHPMTDEHYIEFILLELQNGYAVKFLKPNDEPKAEFALPDGEKVVRAYAYCNLHSLWVTEI